MNPSTALAQVAVAELIRLGVTDVVLAPGSRSAPLALELAAGERRGDLNLHVRVDERSAGFLALGIARVTGIPAAVVCTSGTAVANLAPAVVEASYAGVPMILLTADRPPELRNTGANQTIDQVGFFGQMVRRSADIVGGEPTPTAVVRWRDQVGQAVSAAAGAGGDGRATPAGAGPVQLNLGFREPLVPELEVDPAEPSANPVPPSGVPGAAPDATASRTRLSEPVNYVLGDLGLREVPRCGVLVVGDVIDPSDSVAAEVLAQACGWPIVSEPSGNAQFGPSAVPAASLVLDDPEWLAAQVPDLVVTVGRFGLSRSTMALVRAAKTHVAVGLSGRDRPDPLHTAAAVLPSVPKPPIDDPVVGWTGPDPDWFREWRAAGDAAAAAVHRELDRDDTFTGAHVARAVLDALGDEDLLLVAASRPVRDVELVAKPGVPGEGSSSPRIIGNRGASGIDGLVSTAVGAALAAQRRADPGRTVALLGDLAFLHDHNGLLLPAAEGEPDLTIVVADNNGGGIFSGLEQGAPQFAEDFERVFGTPHDLDLAAIARGAGAAAVAVHDEVGLRAALARPAAGLRVVVARTADRVDEQRLRVRLAEAARTSVSARSGGDR